jgi:pimeloyl-ACP methyl ester carboxylesterase
MNKLLVTAVLAAIAAPLPAAATPGPARFSVVTVGTGPDVILIPGLSSTRDVWTATAERLKATHRVHLVQLRGFGEPAGINASGPVLQPFVAELATYIRDRRLKRTAVIGHSMGGLAALMLAADHPSIAGKVMVVDAFPFIGAVFGADTVEAIAPRAEQMRAMLIGNAGKMTPDFATKANCPETLAAPATVQGNMTNSGTGACLMRHGALASDLRVVAQAMYDDMLTDVRPRLSSITVPVTMLYPQDDRLISRTQADALYANAYRGTKQLTLKRIEGSYHFIMQDQPKAFADALDSFLSEAPR